MTNTPPNDPRSSRRSALGFDEFIAILVAFGFIGSILFWTLSRRQEGFNLGGLLSPSPIPTLIPNQGENLNVGASPAPEAGVQAIPTPTVTADASPSPVATLPATGEATVTTGGSPSPAATVPATGGANVPATPGVTTLIPPVPVATPNGTLEVPASPNGVTTPPAAQPTVSPSPAAVSPTPTQTAAPQGLAPLPPLKPARQPLKFVDVPAGFWASPFIDALSARGVIQGFEGNTFRPNQPVTRAEFAALIQKAFDNQAGDKTVQYKDLKANFWANPAIDRATKIGFLRGYPGNIFQPQQRIPRVQALVALASGLNLKSSAPPNQVLNIYKDAKNIPKYALDRIAAATQNGLVVNYPNRDVLNPNRNITRAEVAAVVYQALVKAGRVEPIASPNIIKPK